MDLMMKELKGSKKKGLILRTWKRCRSLGSNINSSKKSKSSCASSSNRVVAPEGCFWVCVGEEKQKFCLKTDCLKHPLFKMLLEEAESEYGFTIDGPLELPCGVDLFIKVLVEMEYYCDDDDDDDDDDDEMNVFGPIPCRCSFSSSYQLLPSPRLMLAFNKV